jgi:hypothetical protein
LISFLGNPSDASRRRPEIQTPIPEKRKTQKPINLLHDNSHQSYIYSTDAVVYIVAAPLFYFLVRLFVFSRKK